MKERNGLAPNRWRIWAALAVLALGVQLAAPELARGAVKIPEIHPQPLDDFDSRSAQAQPPSPAAQAIVSSLGARASWNIFGTVNSLTKHAGFLATGLTGDPVTAARNWIRANKALFRLSDAGVDALELVNDSRMSGYNGHAVTFRQRFGSLASAPDGLIIVGIAGGKIATVSSSAAGDLPPPGAASIPATVAWINAALNVGLVASPGDISNAREENGWTVFEVRNFDYYQRARLMAFPTPTGGVRPAYESNVVHFKDGLLLGYTLFVDAQTGQVLYRENRVDQIAQLGLLAQVAQPRTSVFTGAYAPPACGPLHGPYTAIPGDKRIDVVATSGNPVNDIVIHLYYDHDNNPATPPQAVAAQDLLTSPEHLQYVPDGGVPPGNYFVEICPFTPDQPPDGYGGTITFSPVAGTAFAYPPKWKVFPASPRMDYTSLDIRRIWCWEIAGTCDPVHPQKPELFNLAARGPWDHNFRLNTPTDTTMGNAAVTAEAWLATPTPFGALGPGPTGYRPVSQSREYYEVSPTIQPWTNQWKTAILPGQTVPGCSPGNFVTPQANDRDSATINLFAMHNRMHDWSYFLGFTEGNYNLQDFNFGNTAPGPFPLGRENDPEIGSVQAGAISGGPPTYLGRDNANQLTLQDGVPGLTNMYLWQPIASAFYSPCVDGDFDMPVIGHEYTHAISNRMVGGPDSGLSGPQAGAMGESWSDLTAVEYLNEYKFVPVQGEHPFSVGAYVTGNPEKGIRNYNMARNLQPPPVLSPQAPLTNLNPLNYSNIGYDHVGVQVHADGEIWSATNYDIRQALIAKYNASFPAGNDALQRNCADGKTLVTQCPGNRRWMQIVFDAWLLMPPTVSYLDARDKYLAADVMRFGGANQTELWRVFARRGMGQHAVSAGNADPDPKPSFESPLEGEITFRFNVVDAQTNAAINTAKIFVGHYEARSVPIADTIPGGTTSDTASFVTGTFFDFLVQAPGYGHLRFKRNAWPGGIGNTYTLTIRMPKNQASITNGATVDPTSDGVNRESLFDDTEATNWASLVAPAVGDKITVDLAGGAQTVRRVQVSAMTRPANPNNTADSAGQNSFTALRQFEIRACTAGANALNLACSNAIDTGFTTIFTSPANAFPSVRPRPVAPDLILREFDVTDTVATHVQLRVLNTQCTGGPDFQGEQDSDPTNSTDCDTVSANGGRVRAAELQVFTAPAGPPAADPAVLFTMTAPLSASAGSTIEYDMSYTNLGPFPSSNARVTDVLPAELDFVSATGGGAFNAATRTVTWNLGTVPVGVPGSLKLTARIKPTVLPTTVIPNQADYTADLTVATPAAAVTTVIP